MSRKQRASARHGLNKSLARIKIISVKNDKCVIIILLVIHKGCEADHSPPSSAEVKEWAELYLHSPIRLHVMVLS